MTEMLEIWDYIKVVWAYCYLTAFDNEFKTGLGFVTADNFEDARKLAYAKTIRTLKEEGIDGIKLHVEVRVSSLAYFMAKGANLAALELATVEEDTPE